MYISLSLSHASGVTIKKRFPQWQIVPTVVMKHTFPLVYSRARCRFVVSFKPPADRTHRKKWHVLLGEMPDNVVTKKTVTTHDDVESGIREGRGIVILSFCHITRDYAHPTRQRTLLSSIIIHVFRITPYFGPYTNNRDRRNNDYWTCDSLPDIMKKAKTALSHRWRVISNPWITSFFLSITGLSFTQ